MSCGLTVAIDGPVASGKTTVGRLLAQKLGARFLDTGSMYRAVALEALRRGIDLDDEEALVDLARSLKMEVVASPQGHRLLVDGRDVTDRLRQPEVDRAVSLVAKVSGVRRALVAQQRAVAEGGPIVVVGRDIGTVVLPCARLKVYLDASPEERARRRWRELKSQGRPAALREVLRDLRRRDALDTGRQDSPLKPAPDAVIVETDDVPVEQVVERVLEALRRA